MMLLLHHHSSVYASISYPWIGHAWQEHIRSMGSLLRLLAVTICLCLSGNEISRGQFINIQIEVEPQVDTTVEQPLDFGQAISGIGLQDIPLGSPSMGIFQIRALRTQRILLSIDIDDELVHEDPLIDARIPLNLNASYTSTGQHDPVNSTPLDSDLQAVIVNPPAQNPNAVWSSIYVYIYGSVNIAAVPVGTYRGEILLTIVYE